MINDNKTFRLILLSLEEKEYGLFLGVIKTRLNIQPIPPKDELLAFLIGVINTPVSNNGRQWIRLVLGAYISSFITGVGMAPGDYSLFNNQFEQNVFFDYIRDIIEENTTYDDLRQSLLNELIDEIPGFKSA